MDLDLRIHGAGLAGNAAALRLSAFGRSVECVERRQEGRRPPEETVVQTARPLLESFGLLETSVQQWPGTPRHAVIWGSDEVRWRDRAEHAPGFRIVRRDFDSLLLDQASEHGALFVHEQSAARAALTVVATGKTATPAARTRIVDSLPSTVALWTTVDPPAPWADTTLIEAVREGWWWWLPLSDGRASLALLCDADEVRARGRRATWEAARAGARGPARGIDVVPDAAVVATARRREVSDALLIGDAASSIDPLSSQGVEKALSSADEASLVANTALELPERRDELIAHHRAWEKALFDAHALRALDWYAREERFEDAPFWSRRVEQRAARTPAERGPLPPSFRVADAVEARTVWKRSDRALIPVDGFGLPDALALDRIGDVPLAPLFPLLEAPTDLKTVIDRARRLPDFFLLSAGRIDGALTELFARGLLSRV